MLVSELIEKLSKLPSDAEARIIYDGCSRMGADFVWLSKGGQVLLSGYGETIDNLKDTPFDNEKEPENEYVYYRNPDDPEDF